MIYNIKKHKKHKINFTFFKNYTTLTNYVNHTI